MDQKVKTGYRLNKKILDALESRTRIEGVTPGEYIENLLLLDLKSKGDLPEDMKPLKDRRGGRREGAGRKSNKV